jgi:hypothetical protein
MRPIYIDIETAPIHNVEAWLPDFSPRRGTKDEAKQAAQVAEKREAALRDAALDLDLSRIVCLGTLDGHFEDVRTCENDTEEAEALTALWSHIRSLAKANEDWCFVGYNLLAFDLPRLYRRCLYLDVETYGIQREKWRHARVIDLQDVLSEQGRFTYRSLDYYAKRFNLLVPADPCDGSEIPGLVARGEWELIRQHNRADLYKTKLLAERIRAVPRVTEHVAA